MNRLTKKYDDGSYGLDRIDCFVEMKLGQLEDIEEELEIDLIVYHKLMNMLYCGDKSKLFIKDSNGNIIEVKCFELDYCKKKIILYKSLSLDDCDEYVFPFSEYGRRFALTREELKNDK